LKSKQTINLKKLHNSVLSQIKIPDDIQVKVRIDDELTLDADHQLLKRVFINLITNAIQAMPTGGELTLEAQTMDDKNVRVVIEDTGVGIPEGIKDKVFQPLFTTKSRGQGFGLAVCRRIIEAHGGTINFESQAGKGTRFTLIFPSKPKP
jgi:signal transduction histidine kinase